MYIYLHVPNYLNLSSIFIILSHYYLQIMSEYNQEEQRAFLQFVTGCPRYPSIYLSPRYPSIYLSIHLSIYPFIYVAQNQRKKSP